jgi:gliding motility associated protien GldN
MNRVYLIVLFIAGMSVQSIGQTRNPGTSPAGTQQRPAGTQPRTAAPGTGTTAPAQTAPQQPAAPANTAYSGNPSVRPIPESDMMYRRTVWRVVDLREKQNRPLYSVNHEITKIIMDAVKRGELTVYKDDSLKKTMTPEEYRKTLVKPGEEIVETEEDKQARLEADKQLAQIEAAKRRQMGAKYVAPPPTEAASMGPIEYNPRDIKKLELKEDGIFDKKRSRMYYDIKAVTLKVPNAVTGFDDVIGAFAYSDLVKVFRNHPQEAIWYNMQNNANHLNLADAFDLRMFGSYIKKVSNPNDDDLKTIHGGSEQAILAAQRALEEMIEFEYSLWSY